MELEYLLKFCSHGRERTVLKAEALGAGIREGALASLSYEPADSSAGGQWGTQIYALPIPSARE